MNTFTLYRFFNERDDLLYIGLTVNPGNRFERHRGDKTWWPEVARIEMEQHPDAQSLRLAEREAIREEKPRYNVRMNERQHHVDELTWLCQACGHAIADGEGYLFILTSDLAEYRTLEADYERRTAGRTVIDGATFISFPEAVRWHILHAACDPDPASGDYGISIERVRTPRALLGWTAHLLESKGWLQDTNWDAILRGHGHET